MQDNSEDERRKRLSIDRKKTYTFYSKGLNLATDITTALDYFCSEYTFFKPASVLFSAGVLYNECGLKYEDYKKNGELTPKQIADLGIAFVKLSIDLFNLAGFEISKTSKIFIKIGFSLVKFAVTAMDLDYLPMPILIR